MGPTGLSVHVLPNSPLPTTSFCSEPLDNRLRCTKYYNHKYSTYVTLFENVNNQQFEGGGGSTSLAKEFCMHSCHFNSHFASLSFIPVIKRRVIFKSFFLFHI